MKYSIIDQIPVMNGQGPEEALQDAETLVTCAENWGYHRYWLAEHHGTRTLASSCPELLVAHLASKTTRIRLGTGGIMLNHYSPFKVSQSVQTLCHLNPGRIDIGLGRAPGTISLLSEALAEPHPPLLDEASFNKKLCRLLEYVKGELPQAHPLAGLPLLHTMKKQPQLFLLSSSGQTAELAGKLGMGLALAHFIGGNSIPQETASIYRKAFIPSPIMEEPNVMLACSATTAKDRTTAQHLATSSAYWTALIFSRNIPELLPPEEITKRTLTKEQRAIYALSLRNFHCGTPQQCKDALLVLARHYQADELAIINILYDKNERLRIYEDLAP